MSPVANNLSGASEKYRWDMVLFSQSAIRWITTLTSHFFYITRQELQYFRLWQCLYGGKLDSSGWVYAFLVEYLFIGINLFLCVFTQRTMICRHGDECPTLTWTQASKMAVINPGMRTRLDMCTCFFLYLYLIHINVCISMFHMQNIWT